MKKSKQRICMTLAALMALSAFFGGCSKKNETLSNGSSITYPDDGVYPLQCEDTLTVWAPLNAALTTVTTNFGNLPLAEELEKRTGVKVTYEHPASGMESEQFNLLLTSDDMPDIVVADWQSYGPQRAIDDGNILALTDAIDKWAPNYKKLLSEMPDVDRSLKASSGDYYVFGFIRGDDALCTYAGPIVRADWLEELGLEIPETIDEWETMLTAFKEKKGATAPLSFSSSDGILSNGLFSGAYDTPDGFYLDDKGKVHYGAAENGFKETLALLNSWYEKGLIDKNLPSVDSKILTNNVTNHKTGATFGLVGGGVGTWITTMRGVGDTTFDLAAAPYPVLKKGDVPMYSHRDNPYTNLRAYAISTNCKNIELATRWLDYGYSEEGNMLYNYGVEGLTYEMVDGKVQLTDFVTKNPDGLAMSTVLQEYAMSTYSGPTVQNKDVIDATRTIPRQNEAVEVWAKTNVKKHKLPALSFTEEETNSMGTKLVDVITYKNEMMYAFIMGTEDLENYDSFVAEMKRLGLDDLINIYQDAYDRYKKL